MHVQQVPPYPVFYLSRTNRSMKHAPIHTYLLALLPSLGACEHEADLPAPHQPPVASIAFSSPAEGTVYRNGDTVTIEAVAVSTEDFHGYTVSITKAGDTATYFLQEVHAHNDTLAIRHQWKDTLTAPANLEARITLVVDHDGNTLTGKAGIRHE